MELSKRLKDEKTISLLQSVSGRSTKEEPIAEDTTSQLESIPSLCSQLSPCSHGAKLVKDWTVNDVCQFVESIEPCKSYVEVSFITKYSINYFFACNNYISKIYREFLAHLLSIITILHLIDTFLI